MRKQSSRWALIAKIDPMKKKYRSFGNLQKASKEFAAYLGASCDPGFAELVQDFPPPEQSQDETKSNRPKGGKTGSRRRPMLAESQLDLHGLTWAEAKQKTNSYLLTQKQRGRKTLRIITGKGLHSSGPGILRDLVEVLLLDAREAGIITGYRWEQEEKEKSGAVLVFLS